MCINFNVYISVMTAIEVFEEITSKEKWYAGFISAQNATNVKRRFKEGTLEYETLLRMFTHYGYELSTNSPWKKK